MEERITSSKSTLSSHSSIGATGTIKFTNFCANWTPEQATLNNINLNVGNKELFAIVGHVGSGKVKIQNSFKIVSNTYLLNSSILCRPPCSNQYLVSCQQLQEKFELREHWVRSNKKNC